MALVVGNSVYRSINALPNPSNDASDFAAALETLGFEVILRKDLDKGSFGSALAEFARRSAGADAALFYYAGHGIQYQRQNYLLPTDIEVRDYEDVEFQAVSLNRVMDALKRSDGVRIVILDACRDNPLDKKLAGRGLQRVSGLAPVDKAEGLVVAYATATDSVAQDGTGRNSPFTEALVRRMTEPGLEIATLFRRVSQDVYERTRGQQRPEVAISLLRDFYLNAADSDTAVWGRIRQSYELADIETFLRRFPSSPLAAEAQARADFIRAVRRQAEAQAAANAARDQAAAEGRERQAAAERERLSAEARARAEERDRAATEAAERERQAAADRERAAERQRLAQAREAEEKARAEAAERERVAALVRARAAAQAREREAAEERERAALKAASEREQSEAVRREVERLAAQRSRVAAIPPADTPALSGSSEGRAGSPVVDEAERRRLKAAFEQRQKRREALALVRTRSIAAGLDVSAIDGELRELDRLDVAYVARLRKEAGTETR